MSLRGGGTVIDASAAVRSPSVTMSRWSNIADEFLYKLPSEKLNDFNRVMDTLSNSDWLNFASRVLQDQCELRVAQRRENRTDYVMHYWGVRNGTVGDLLSLLEELGLLRARDIILSWRPDPPSAPPRLGPPPQTPPKQQPPPNHHSLFDPQDQSPDAGPCAETRVLRPDARVLPRPGPPPPSLKTEHADPRERPPPQPSAGDPVSGLSCSAHCWPLEEVLRGTDNFSVRRCVGEGGFGQVYHATMRSTEYAVKKLKEDSDLDWTLVKESFKTEVEKLTQYRHPNIVDFGGYCMEAGVYCLVYVYMPSGSLQDRLHSKGGGTLSWAQRVTVLLGTARAVQFLHSSNPALVHGDIKSSNILLGDRLEPRLGDFGLARFCRAAPGGAGRTSAVAWTSKVRGTLAYLPPEYVTAGELSIAIDTYSYGVVLLELLTGRRALEMDGSSRTTYLKDLVKEADEVEEEEKGGQKSESGGGVQASAPPPAEEKVRRAAAHIWRKHLDPRLPAPAPPGALELCALACRCLDKRKKKRPPMAQVFDTLEALSRRLQPAPPASHSTSPCSPQPPPTPPLLPSSSLSDSLPPPAPLDSLAESFSRLGPREDTYYCPPQPSDRPATATTPWRDGLYLSKSQGGEPQTPCESDESQGYSQYLLSEPSPSSSLYASPADCPSPDPLAGLRRPPTQAAAASTSAESCQPGHGIVMNPAKEQFFRKLALYEQGLLPSAELLSTTELSGSLYREDRGPEESDEFQC
ncbi:interleukin-1 receptor-associated kinase 1 isoform X2 [Amia ocellicauda]|uniref:interleukin-1 receptor-associated kinase 1 isoform X2 n=1 Tax=Amia ocellicauda TaxID=2972642 RepID=UPI0034641682